MRTFFVQYENDGEISSFIFEAMTLHQAGERALSILYLNDCSPGGNWRILDDGMNVIPYADLSLNPNSTAVHYYNRPDVDWDLGDEDCDCYECRADRGE